MPVSVLILILFIVAMAGWVLLAEFCPKRWRRRDDDEDAGEPALA